MTRPAGAAKSDLDRSDRAEETLSDRPRFPRRTTTREAGRGGEVSDGNTAEREADSRRSAALVASSSTNVPTLPAASGRYSPPALSSRSMPGSFDDLDALEAQVFEGPTRLEELLADLSTRAQSHSGYPKSETGVVDIINKYKPSTPGEKIEAKNVTDADAIEMLRSIGMSEDEIKDFNATNFRSMAPSQASKVLTAAVNYMFAPGMASLAGQKGWGAGTATSVSIGTVSGLAGIPINAYYQTIGVALGADQRGKTFQIKTPKNISDKIGAGEQAAKVQTAIADLIEADERFSGKIQVAIAGSREAASPLTEEQIRSAPESELKELLSGHCTPIQVKEVQIAASDLLKSRQNAIDEHNKLDMALSVGMRHVKSNRPSFVPRTVRGATSAGPAVIEEREKDFGWQNAMGLLAPNEELGAAQALFVLDAGLSIIGSMIGEGTKQLYLLKEIIAQPDALLTETGRKLRLEGKPIGTEHLKASGFDSIVEWDHDRYTAEALKVLKKEVAGYREEQRGDSVTPERAEELETLVATAEAVEKILTAPRPNFEELIGKDNQAARAFTERVERESKSIFRRYFDSKSELAQGLAKKREVAPGEWLSREFKAQSAQQGTQALMGVVLGTLPAAIVPRIVNAVFHGVRSAPPMVSLGVALFSLATGATYAQSLPKLIRIKNEARFAIAALEKEAADHKAALAKAGTPMTPAQEDQAQKELTSKVNKEFLKQFNKGMWEQLKDIGRTVTFRSSPETVAQKAMDAQRDRLAGNVQLARTVTQALGEPEPGERLPERVPIPSTPPIQPVAAAAPALPALDLDLDAQIAELERTFEPEEFDRIVTEMRHATMEYDFPAVPVGDEVDLAAQLRNAPVPPATSRAERRQYEPYQA